MFLFQNNNLVLQFLNYWHLLSFGTRSGGLYINDSNEVTAQRMVPTPILQDYLNYNSEY